MYIAMINIHGLLRSEQIEMGRDADTGGQTRYVIDLAKELSSREGVKVDLFTRKISDRHLSKDYSRQIEKISDSVKIVRLPCGSGKYYRKEKLWPYLDEYVDYLIEYFKKTQVLPDVIHGHYADGGYIAREIAAYFNIPLIFTGHSLGRNKYQYLKSIGYSEEKIEEYYAMSRRIQEEEENIDKADMVITSTEYERDELYREYEKRNLKKFTVLPPGFALDKFFPYYHYEIASHEISEEQKIAQYTMIKEINRFLTNVDKPLILALCRPEARKNIDVLIELYGKSPELQAIANLAIFAGIRDDINEMEEGGTQVLTDMLLQMDRYDLYGKMAIPKRHNPETDVPEVYRIAALRGGVFVSAAALENFGLTFIEASAVGLPFIGTDKGGVKDIRKNCDSGILVNIEKPKQIHDAIRKVLTDKDLWDTLSKNGVENIREVYNWKRHSDLYLDQLSKVLEHHSSQKSPEARYEKSMARRLDSIDHLLISDIDNTITGSDEGVDLFRSFMTRNTDRLGFGIATGRSLEASQEILEELKLPTPDIWICSVGSEIYYGKNRIQDKGWAQHIRRRWNRQRIVEALSIVDEIALQDSFGSQRPYKVSYLLKEPLSDALKQKIHEILSKAKCPHNAIYSHETYLDILPYRAHKGAAIKYLAWKWNLGPHQIITAGDSGNDAGMLVAPFNSVVVGNHEESLKALKKRRNLYFAQAEHGHGLVEGLQKHTELS